MADLTPFLAFLRLGRPFTPLLVSAASLFCLPTRISLDESGAKLPPWEHNRLGSDPNYDGYTPFEDAEACEVCQRITIERLLSQYGYRHCGSYVELQTSARYGCKLCTIILLAIEREGSSRFASMVEFRSDISSNLTLKLRAIKKSQVLNTDLVEIRLGTTTPRHNFALVDDKLATVGLYTDAGEIDCESCFVLELTLLRR